MKKQIKGFILGFVAATVLMAGITVNADSLLKTIHVAENSIKLKINGNPVSVPNFISDGRTYIQVRTLTNLLGKNISWDESTRTVNITDQSPSVSLNSDKTSGSTAPQLTTQEIAKKGDAVVLLETYDEYGNPLAIGSGFLITKEGELVTNYHVVNGASSIKALAISGIVYNATIKTINSSKDLAVLKLQNAKDMPFVKLGDSSRVELGEDVVAIGNPIGLQNVVSVGIVSTKSRHVNGQDYIQITAAISPGSSGGALFNKSGDVIGVTAAMYSNGQALNFAVPINEVKSLL